MHIVNTIVLIQASLKHDISIIELLRISDELNDNANEISINVTWIVQIDNSGNIHIQD